MATRSDKSKPHLTQNSGNVEWFTPPDIVERVRRVMGSIDLDPASCFEANQIVKASHYYNASDDGLNRPWFGNVYLNPPYRRGLIEPFCERLIEHLQGCLVDQAIVLINNATDTNWFRRLSLFSSAICFPGKRIPFLSPAEGTKKRRPLQGQCFFYFGPRDMRFCDLFAEIGHCWVPLNPLERDS